MDVRDKMLQDTACSTEALNHLQGTVLYSSVSGEGMRLEYPLNLQLPFFFFFFLITPSLCI
jgi:hypothetical protein